MAVLCPSPKVKTSPWTHRGNRLRPRCVTLSPHSYPKVPAHPHFSLVIHVPSFREAFSSPLACSSLFETARSRPFIHVLADVSRALSGETSHPFYIIKNVVVPPLKIVEKTQLKLYNHKITRAWSRFLQLFFFVPLFLTRWDADDRRNILIVTVTLRDFTICISSDAVYKCNSGIRCSWVFCIVRNTKFASSVPILNPRRVFRLHWA